MMRRGSYGCFRAEDLYSVGDSPVRVLKNAVK